MHTHEILTTNIRYDWQLYYKWHANLNGGIMTETNNFKKITWQNLTEIISKAQ